MKEYTENEFYNLKEEDFEKEHRNCVLVSIARLYAHNGLKEELSFRELLDFVFENHTEKDVEYFENDKYFTVKTKNTTLLVLLANKILKLKNSIDALDIEYLKTQKNKNALVIQQYKSEPAHLVFVKEISEIEGVKGLHSHFEEMTILIYNNN